MKNLVPLLAFSILPLFSSANPASAVQTGPPPPMHLPAKPRSPSGGNQCFQDYFNHLKQCRDEFCPNRISNCNDTALEACIDGAKTVLNACLHPG